MEVTLAEGKHIRGALADPRLLLRNHSRDIARPRYKSRTSRREGGRSARYKVGAASVASGLAAAGRIPAGVRGAATVLGAGAESALHDAGALGLDGGAPAGPVAVDRPGGRSLWPVQSDAARPVGGERAAAVRGGGRRREHERDADDSRSSATSRLHAGVPHGAESEATAAAPAASIASARPRSSAAVSSAPQ